MTKRLEIKTKDKSYPVLIGDDVLREVKEFIVPHQKIAVVTDEVVFKLHYETLKNFLPPHHLFIHAPGETSKSVETYWELQTFLLEKDMDRTSLMIAFGGGVVGDLAGFAASTFMRGISYLQLPTTLLAQDSAVGGKVAINHRLGKNMVGAFYPPKAVVFHLPFLKTLDDKQFRSGLAEMIKHGYLKGSEKLLGLMKHPLPALRQVDLSPLIFESIQIKQAMVEEDEQEAGIRAHLNFGHTLGHALEMTHPDLAHGEAVALGMGFSLWLSRYPARKYQEFLRKTGYPNPANIEKIDTYLAYMGRDKKNSRETINFVLLDGSGCPCLKGLSREFLENSLKDYFKSQAGAIVIPGDKSITHRAIILSSLSQGVTRIENPLLGEDCLHTLKIFQALGVASHLEGDSLILDSPGAASFTKGAHYLDAGNSGTTARLLMGLFAGLPLLVTLTGDNSLQGRPMRRVAAPISGMGADISLSGSYLPAAIIGRPLHGIRYTLPIASAQVKSAIMLAALSATGETVITEPVPTRDHTEKMFEAFGLACRQEGRDIIINGPQVPKSPGIIRIPGDISSAAFFIVAALVIPNTDIVLKNVGINPTRTGILQVCEEMGADIQILSQQSYGGEPVADIRVRHTAALKPFSIKGELIPRLIDEIPVLSLLGLFADGISQIRDASELRVKETDRLGVTVSQLEKMGGRLISHEDGMDIFGTPHFVPAGGEFDSFGDHRMGMMLSIASLLTKEKMMIHNLEAINVSYPGFFEDLKLLNRLRDVEAGYA